jgi:hypothetical protein
MAIEHNALWLTASFKLPGIKVTKQYRTIFQIALGEDFDIDGPIWSPELIKFAVAAVRANIANSKAKSIVIMEKHSEQEVRIWCGTDWGVNKVKTPVYLNYKPTEEHDHWRRYPDLAKASNAWFTKTPQHDHHAAFVPDENYLVNHTRRAVIDERYGKQSTEACIVAGKSFADRILIFSQLGGLGAR